MSGVRMHHQTQVRPLMDRRGAIKRMGLGLVAASVGGTLTWMSPEEARAAGATLRVLTASEATLLERLAEALLPGARAAGVAHFVDHHLAMDEADSLLMLRYLDWPAPYAGFYKGCLAALQAVLQRRFPTGAEPDDIQWDALISDMKQGQPEGWQGPPAGLFYFVLRSDAVDVVYGTERGFEKLGMPYMAHIMPPTPW